MDFETELKLKSKNSQNEYENTSFMVTRGSRRNTGTDVQADIVVIRIDIVNKRM